MFVLLEAELGDGWMTGCRQQADDKIMVSDKVAYIGVIAGQALNREAVLMPGDQGLGQVKRLVGDGDLKFRLAQEMIYQWSCHPSRA